MFGNVVDRVKEAEDDVERVERAFEADPSD